MQLTRVFAVLSLAAATIAAPTVDVAKRTEGTGGTSCGQSQGVLSCCQQGPTAKPVSQLGSSITSPLGGILGILPALLPLIVPVVQVAVQCVALVDVQACGAANVCCMAPSSGNTNTGGLISLLNNNDITVCPGVTL